MRVRQLRTQALATSTRGTYNTHLKSYLSFCNLLACSPLPVTQETVCRYVAHLSARLSYSSVRQYLSVLRYISLEANLPNPLLDNWHLSTLLKGLKREMGASVCKKAPVTPELLLGMRSRLIMSSSLDRAVWAAALLMFFCLLRKSNALPASLNSFCPGKHLARQDFSLAPQGLPYGLVVNLRWSKTIQYRERALLCPLPKLPGHPLCPVTALAAAFALDPLPHREGPAFWFSHNGVWKPLTYPTFLTRFRTLLSALGRDPASFAAHSFRRGGASWAFAQGLPGEFIKILGDWRSQAYLGYLEIPMASKFQAISRFAQGLPSGQ